MESGDEQLEQRRPPQPFDSPNRIASGQNRVGVGVDPPDIDTSKSNPESVAGEDRLDSTQQQRATWCPEMGAPNARDMCALPPKTDK